MMKTQNRRRSNKTSRVEQLEDRRLLAGLISQWIADDLNETWNAGDEVANWVDQVGALRADAIGAPQLQKGSFGGRSAVRFDAADGDDFLEVGLPENPVNGRTDFSVTVAFSTNSDALRGGDGDWFDASGLVDADSLGFSHGWGLVINENGQIGAGLGGGFGNPSTSLFSNARNLNDGQIHIATMTRSGADLSVYVDDQAPQTRNDANSDPRSRIAMTIGSVASDGGGFTGDIGQVRIFDGQLASAEVAALHSEIHAYYANQVPSAVDDQYFTEEDGFFLLVNEIAGVLNNDTDVDGDSLTAVLVDPPQHGILTLDANGSFIYDPEPNFFGQDTFTYSAFDFRPSAPATVTLNVAAKYDPVVPAEDHFKFLSGTVLSIDAQNGLLSNDRNVDQAELTAIIADNVTAGNLNLNPNGAFTYDPQGFTGTMTFSYRVDDGTQLTSPTRVTMIVNAPPNPVDDNYGVNEDEALTVAAVDGVLKNDIDPDGNAITSSLVNSTRNGELTYSADGAFHYVPGPNFFGEDSFSYRVSDGIDEAETTGTVNITIAAVNDAPVARSDLVVAFVNESAEISAALGLLANDSDVEDDTLSARLMASPAIGTVVVKADGSLTYTPRPDFSGNDTFSYVANDGDLDSEVTTVNVVVATLDQQVVINEVHYDPPDNTIPAEFIEVVNQGNAPTDLSNWFFSDGINFVFPLGTVIAPGEHLVIAQNPETIRTQFGQTSLGPWTGRLSSEGERIVLRNALREIVDEVDYQQGFPWPVASGGEGPSMELINPALDNDLGGSWRSGSTPTPGEKNSIFAVNAPPQIRQVDHNPQQPTSDKTTLVTAKVTDPGGVASVELQYQIVTAGNYVPAMLPIPLTELRRNRGMREPNPAYFDPVNWTTIAMVDTGANGDAVAGDDIYSVMLPVQDHRSLVRYRILVTDGQDDSVMVPYEDDESRNFAYFVYDGVPEYNGHSVESLKSLPIYHLIARGEDVTQVMAYNGRDQISQGTQARFAYNWPATIVYDETVYDNINFRLRGANGRYHLLGKRSMRFRFNDGNYMQWHDQDGNPYSEKLRTLTTGKMFDNRQTLTYSLNEAVNLEIYRTLGLPGINTHYSHFRVIDDVEEHDRWAGDFWGFNFMMETYDVRFLDQHGLERGNLYKLINQTRDPLQQQRYQAPNAVTGGADHQNIERNLTGRSTADYIDAHVNLEKYYIFHAVAEAIRHYDFWPDANKNMVYYFEPNYLPENNHYGKLWILPWDTDASWGPTWNSGHDVVFNSIFPAGGGGSDGQSTPELWPEYFNNVRQVRDLLWQPDQIGPLVEQFGDILKPLEAADKDRWNGGPREHGRYNGLSGAGLRGIDAMVEDMMNFAFDGGNWPGGSVGAGGRARHLDRLQGRRGEDDEIPATPTITYTGAENFPANELRFESSNFEDPQGNDTFGRMEWRIAEVTDPLAPAFDPNEKFKLEWTTSWESGELTEFTKEIIPPSVAVESGHTYRARVRMKDNSGRWSHWSDPVQFTATAPTSSELVHAIRISELHYHPADPDQNEVAAGHNDADDFEFIELENISTEVIDLSGVQFVRAEVEGDSQGIEFDFSDGSILELQPSARVLVVEDVAAFTFRYGDSLPVTGEWSGGLSNGGEQLTLLGDGFTIHQFSYDDNWFDETDGDGPSLEIIDIRGDLANWNTNAGWRPSGQIGGTPGERGTARPGDSNRDGVFNSRDLVLVFQAGEYEDNIPNNSTFEEGDWDGDGDFTTSDLVFAFSEGDYSLQATAGAVLSLDGWEWRRLRERNPLLRDAAIAEWADEWPNENWSK